MGKKIIVSKEQLLEGIMDTNKTEIVFDGNNASEMGANAQNKYNDALRAGIKPNSMQISGKSKMNNASDKDETNISFDTSQSNIKDAVTNAVTNAVNNGADINKLNVVGSTEDINNGTYEYKVYTKGQIKEARLKSLQENSSVFTKQQLMEEMLSDNFDDMEDIKSKINSAMLFDVLEAYASVYGNPNELSSERNIIAAIMKKIAMGTPQQKQEFLQRMDGSYESDEEPIDLELDF